MKWKSLWCVPFLSVSMFPVSCDEKQAEVEQPADSEETKWKEPKADWAEGKSLYDLVAEKGLLELIHDADSGFKPRAMIANSHGEALVYYNEVLGKILVCIPNNVHHGLIFEINGKSFHEANNGFTRAYLIKGEKESKICCLDTKGLSGDDLTKATANMVLIGAVLDFKKTDNVLIKGLFNDTNLQSIYEISYDPNYGWRTSSTMSTPIEKHDEANVFCFSNEPMLEQFKEALKDKNTCRVRVREVYAGNGGSYFPTYLFKKHSNEDDPGALDFSPAHFSIEIGNGVIILNKELRLEGKELERLNVSIGSRLEVYTDRAYLKGEDAVIRIILSKESDYSITTFL